MSENYKAVIVKLNGVRKHSNADRLSCVNIFGNNIIVGKDVKDGDIGVYFPLESALSKEFMYENSLNSSKELNRDSENKGYFGKHGRVKAQKFRGENSMGFWMPLTCLSYLGVSDFEVGEEFEEVNGHPICSKYIPPTKTQGSGIPKTGKAYKKKESKVITNQFRFHYDTSQLGKNMHKINPEDVISISWKMHGTSAIASKVLCKKRLSWKEKVAKLLGIKVIETEYSYLYASRKVVKNEAITPNHYYNYDLWTEVGKTHFEGKLHDGESVYYEIVGYTKDGSYIQKGFDYGCQQYGIEGEVSNRTYVYRVTRTAPDGSFIDLDWGQVKERCKELGVEYCPEIYYGKADDFYYHSVKEENQTLDSWRNELLLSLQEKYVYDQDSQFCINKVPEEGIVVRKEGLYLEAFKLKSFRFLEFESKQLDEEVIDIETSQSIENE